MAMAMAMAPRALPFCSLKFSQCNERVSMSMAKDLVQPMHGHEQRLKLPASPEISIRAPQISLQHHIPAPEISIQQDLEFEIAARGLKLSSLTFKWRDIQGEKDWEGLLDPLDIDLRSEIIKYGEFAQVCYDCFDSCPYSRYHGTCKYSLRDLLQQVGLRDTNYEVTKYIYASCSGIPGLSSKSPIRGCNWMGFVAVSNSEETRRLGRRDIVVAWRGTVLSIEWLENLKDFLQPARLNPEIDDVKVETGFLHLYTCKNQASKSAREQVMEELTRLVHVYPHEDLSITITGHSLGGALGLINSYDIAESGLSCSPEGLIPVSVISFGAPRVGNEAFSKRVAELGVKVLRVVNEKDLVPKMPGLFINESLSPCPEFVKGLPWSYSHVGVELSLISDDSPYLKPSSDPCNHHNLEAYLHLVDGYQGRGKPFKSTMGRDVALVNKFSDFLRKENNIVGNWWQEANSGLVQDERGWYIQPPRPLDHCPFPSTF